MLEHLNISTGAPVLIAGPTASGKSALALEIAQRLGGVIINADSMQVYEGWRVLTARPSPEDEARAPHMLYGHVAQEAAYSVGHWLRDVAPLLEGGARPIIVGGTGLYFSALTEGLAEIPPTPAAIRAEADSLRTSGALQRMIDALDEATRARIDLRNPMRVQRAWEVQRTTGRGLADWQDATPPPLLPRADAHALLLDADPAWLNARIAGRLGAMLEAGALGEVRANMAHLAAARPSARAIGAPELAAHLRGEISLTAAQEAATIATRQFAKRQRTWFRARMSGWQRIALP
ncbi:tRNA (adenosine(37)-N6)-dimethylallyltransferase MiaA [Roseovarius sp. M141]|uniref:tRNA (adenosine(37)-N6)-dimethylallyltransferase MiaA n=1 Tax=Roseovarius sp. M141 TaxID=2583806 RepID=UPI0020CE48F1|nr:tRNA (adenosine(37)-N6)-dimethylallyltransferase MiaA [Roseovarius sp. M141]MCQ0093070.1 tRNA (adenosine(37)-N6)-dimethylallyltransferase MiaA [Roseovarius sp. M141]